MRALLRAKRGTFHARRIHSDDDSFFPWCVCRVRVAVEELYQAGATTTSTEDAEVTHTSRPTRLVLWPVFLPSARARHVAARSAWHVRAWAFAMLQVTALGEAATKLPVDLPLCKLILLGTAMAVSNSAIVMV